MQIFFLFKTENKNRTQSDQLFVLIFQVVATASFSLVSWPLSVKNSPNGFFRLWLCHNVRHTPTFDRHVTHIESTSLLLMVIVVVVVAYCVMQRQVESSISRCMYIRKAQDDDQVKSSMQMCILALRCRYCCCYCCCRCHHQCCQLAPMGAKYCTVVLAVLPGPQVPDDVLLLARVVVYPPSLVMSNSNTLMSSLSLLVLTMSGLQISACCTCARLGPLVRLIGPDRAGSGDTQRLRLAKLHCTSPRRTLHTHTHTYVRSEWPASASAGEKAAVPNTRLMIKSIQYPSRIEQDFESFCSFSSTELRCVWWSCES